MSDKPRPSEITLLIVDDDPANLESYVMGFARTPYRVLTAQGGAKALETLRAEDVDVVLTDMRMPEVDGLEVVRAATGGSKPAVPIVITAFGTIETAVEAMRLGAFDYVQKPVNLMELRAKVEKAIEHHSLRVRNEELQGLLKDRFRFEGVVGVSAKMRAVIDQARAVAASRASVLVQGESGTGKELVARAIHFNSPRASGPFIPIHCAAIPETLLESELFGHEKGAFTGAAQRRLGQFESAQGGTVFLDELGEIPLATQVKLLRVLEQREITRVGATQPIPIDIRLVGATNKRLEEEVRSGAFREDLYYRLNVVRIDIPPLRDRPEDIPALAERFLQELCRENSRPKPEIDKAALDLLMQAPWPGNIRQLRNVLEQTIVFAPGDVIRPADLPQEIRAPFGDTRSAAHPAQQETNRQQALEEETIEPLEDVERRQILRALEICGGNRTQAAERLGISRRTMQRRLKELGL